MVKIFGVLVVSTVTKTILFVQFFINDSSSLLPIHIGIYQHNSDIIVPTSMNYITGSQRGRNLLSFKIEGKNFSTYQDFQIKFTNFLIFIVPTLVR